MISTAWGIGLTLCSGAVLALLGRAAVPALFLLVRGEESDSEFQLELERGEVLSSAVLRFALLYQLASPFLITAAAFELGRQVPGAMCAFGVFNANSFGFPMLLARLAGIYPACAWIVLYSMDMRSPATPLRGIRRVLLVFLFLVFAADTVAQTLFLSNLSPKVITSCCAVVFDPAAGLAENPAGFLASWPQAPLFSALSAVVIVIGAVALSRRGAAASLVYGAMSPLYFFLCLAAMISFVSPHIYALPHHHCPFCVLRGKEALLGVPLTVAAFSGGLCGWSAGVAAWAAMRLGAAEVLAARRRGYLIASLVSFIIYFTGSMAILALYRLYGELL